MEPHDGNYHYHDYDPDRACMFRTQKKYFITLCTYHQSLKYFAGEAPITFSDKQLAVAQDQQDMFAFGRREQT